MARKIRIAAAQVGAVHRTSPRPETLGRMLKLLEDAASQAAEVVLFPETTFTTFFPRYLIEDEAELQSFFEHGDVTTAPNTKPLFDRAKELDVDISVGMSRIKLVYVLFHRDEQWPFVFLKKHIFIFL